MKLWLNFPKRFLPYKQVTAFLTVVVILSAGIAVNYLVELKMLHSVQEHTSKNDSIIQHEKYLQLVEKTVFLITQSENNLETYLHTNESAKLDDYLKNVNSVKKNIADVRTFYEGNVPKYLVNIFIHKSQNMIDLNNSVMRTYQYNGITAALQQIENPERRVALKELSFSAQELVNKLNTKIAFLNNESSNEKNKMLELDKKWNVLSLIFMSMIAFFVMYKMYETNMLNRSLSVAVQKEQRAQMAKDQFVSNVTHELRTPLNSIIGYTNLLLKKEHTAETRQWIQAMKISGNLLMEVINDVLDYSKLESGYIQFSKDPFNLKDVLNNLSKVMQIRAESKNLDFLINIDESMPVEFIGDERKLMQVLVNLCGNSIKFTEAGYIRVDVSLLKRNSSRCWMQFVITDSGVGIEESKLPYIFERFYQVESGQTKKYVGTGLGLPIVKQLVEMQGGAIDVSSHYGKGTEFTVVVPYSENENAGKEQSITFNEPKIYRKQEKQKHILVVDDNEMNRDLMGYILRQGNFCFDNAENGLVALRMLKEKKYDFVLMDVQMPGLSGIETTRKIRSELQLQTPIIGLSGYSLPEEQQASINAGMNAYLTKPVDEVKLFELLDYYADSDAQEPQNLQLKLINVTYLNKITGGNKANIEHLINQVFDTLPNEMKLLQEWFANDNETKMKEIAHNMKTTLHIIGVQETVAEKVKVLEKVDLTKTSDKEKVTELLNDLDYSVKEVLQELRSYLNAA